MIPPEDGGSDESKTLLWTGYIYIVIKLAYKPDIFTS